MSLLSASDRNENNALRIHMEEENTSRAHSLNWFRTLCAPLTAQRPIYNSDDNVTSSKHHPLFTHTPQDAHLSAHKYIRIARSTLAVYVRTNSFVFMLILCIGKCLLVSRCCFLYRCVKMVPLSSQNIVVWHQASMCGWYINPRSVMVYGCYKPMLVALYPFDTHIHTHKTYTLISLIPPTTNHIIFEVQCV